MPGDAEEDRLITQAQIGSLAGVERPTVNYWRRTPGFPAPEQAGDTQLYRQAAVLTWLDGRSIPRRFLKASESEGITYGDRARRALGGAGGAAAVSRPPSTAAGAGQRHDPRDARLVRALMGDLADRVRGAGSIVAFMNLLLSLLFLRAAGGPQWDGVVRQAHAGIGSDGARALLRHIGATVDERLMRLGTLPGMRQSLLGLEPRTYDDLRSVVRQAGLLGPGAFRLMLNEYELRAGLRSGEFFTPSGVARVMVGIALEIGDSMAPEAVYDPYARGGELLAEAVHQCAAQGNGPVRPKVYGYSHERDTARLANMSLALRGVRPQVRLARGAPWTAGPDFDRSRFSLVLTNPPFNMSDSFREERTGGEWPYGPPPLGNDNTAYLQHALASVADGGCAAVVMPNKLGNSQNGAEAEVRRNMVEAGVVACVVALPDRLFSSTPVPVSVWFLVPPTRPCNEVLFLDARRVGTTRKGKRVLQDDDVRAIVGTYRAAASPQPKERERGSGVLDAVVSRETLRERNYSLSPMDHIRTEQATRAAIDLAFTETQAVLELRRRELDRADAAAAGAGSQLDESRSARRRSVALSELCDIQAGPSYTLLSAEQRTPYGEVPLVFPQHLSKGRILETGDRRVPEQLADRLKKFRLEAGDIVCVRSGAIGPPALVGDREAGWLMSTNLLRLRVRDSAGVDPGYLAGYLCRPDAVAWVRDRATATGAPSISAASLGNQPVALPPYEEQRRIATALAHMEAQAAAHLRFATAVLDARAAMLERLMAADLLLDDDSVA
jgi:type I restriction enzyme M protein